METGGGPSSTPNLQSILATLAQHAPTGTHLAPVPSQHAVPITAPAPGCETQDTSSQDQRDASFSSRLKAGAKPQGQSVSAPSKPMIDPSTITTWQDALRCITKISAQNAQFAASIKKMMKEQKAHEMRWYTERQNLKQTQANRSSSAAKAQSILKSLNRSFSVSTPSMDQVEVDPEAELVSFDRKIYAAQQDMEIAMSAEMKALGVPFFGTDRTLVVADGSEPSEMLVPDDHPKWSPIVTETEMLVLRRRMVQHLEDLYRE
ncbi:hypothetical protein PRZ48_012925 [Zasmidium cellare]|uniref:Uncharacterized protein n=1 Tax=Zasmidium cellare TaxID=395010 RepID=A0ABR0E2L4_ZASCE|nr:hypothetical protein PRZ48_012925 [Zasmidium cellare]